MNKEFSQVAWDSQLEDDCRQLVRLAVREDLDRSYDLTTVALIEENLRGGAAVVSRQEGVVAGIRVVETALEEIEVDLQWQPAVSDGDQVGAAQAIGQLWGAARDLLTCERILLNLLGRLCGIATQTRRFVQAVEGTRAAIYDTRKTTPGWRRLEKYAVRCGGGRNHRTGLFDAVLIKDNHLALGRSGDEPWGPAEAIARARQRLGQILPGKADPESVIVEIEVDTFDQLEQALAAGPDIILLDNMTPDEMAVAVARRDAANPAVQLEASGGIDLRTVAAAAASGVERISVGALTHSAVSLDIGLDWHD